MGEIKNLIFDLGGVLIDWNPEYVYLKIFKGDKDKMTYFLRNICTFEWNEQQDAGKLIEDSTRDLVKKFPNYKHEIEAYYNRWEEMLGGAISPNVEILRQLFFKKNHKIVALTNWSAETFPIALKRFDFLHWFEGIVVSGEEKTKKPSREIYQITTRRYGLTPNESLFIDDNLENIKAAQEMGIKTIHYKSTPELVEDLETFGVVL